MCYFLVVSWTPWSYADPHDPLGPRKIKFVGTECFKLDWQEIVGAFETAEVKLQDVVESGFSHKVVLRTTNPTLRDQVDHTEVEMLFVDRACWKWLSEDSEIMNLCI